MIWSEAGVIGSSLGLAALAQVDPITAGEKLGTSSAAVVLGIVCVSCVIANYRQYRDAQDKEKDHNQVLYKLISSSTQSAQANADSNREVAQILVEVKNEMLQCRAMRMSAMRGPC